MFDRLTPPSCREPWRKVGISQHVAALGRGPDLKAASTSDVRRYFRQWRDPCRQTRLEAVKHLCRPGLATQELSREDEIARVGTRRRRLLNEANKRIMNRL